MRLALDFHQKHPGAEDAGGEREQDAGDDPVDA